MAFVVLACSAKPVVDLGDAEPLDASATPDWDRVRTAFSKLSTIAGKGAFDTGNEWQPSYEGGPALSAELSRPHMAMADAAGNVYIADKESHAIRVVTTDGTIHTVAGTSVPGNAPDTETPATQGALSYPNGVWVRADGTFYILDVNNAKVRRVTPEGRMSTLISLGTISTGRGLWVAEDESEALIASGTELLVWTPTAGKRTLAAGFGELGMVLRTSDGRILVGDRTGLRVYEVADDGAKHVLAGNGSMGKFVDGAKATETPFDEPRAVWPYGSGLLVGLHNGCKIIYIDDQGFAHLILQGSAKSHAGDGMPYNPRLSSIGEMRSLTVDTRGNVIFVENDLGFVRVLAAATP